MRIPSLLASSLVLLGACGDDGPSHPPDAPPTADPHDIVVHITNYYTGAGSNAQLLALQDGDGAWTVLTGTNGDYHAHVTSDRYAVMTSCKYDATFSDVSLYYRHVSDGPLNEYGCESAPTPIKLTVVGANVPAGDGLRIRMQSGGSLLFASGANGTIDTLDAAKGTLDGVAVVRDASFQTIGVLRVPATDLQADKTITFDAATRIASSTIPLAMTGVGATPNGAVIATSILTANGRFPVSTTTYQPAGSPFTFSTPPQSFFGSGELLHVRASLDDGREAAATTKTVGAVSLALPTTALTTTNVNLVTAPYARPTFTFTTAAKTLANQWYNLYAIDPNAGIFAQYSPAYVGTAATVTFAMPDFSSLPGFDPTHVPSATDEIDWSVSRDEDNGVDGDGGVTQSASSSGALGAYCGNGHVDAGEACDDAGESATCNYDCTISRCGDGDVNFTAGEECDPPDGTTCDASCKSIAPPPTARRATKAPIARPASVREQVAAMHGHRIR